MKSAKDVNVRKAITFAYDAKHGKALIVCYVYFGDTASTTAQAKAYAQVMKSAGIKTRLDSEDPRSSPMCLGL